MGNTEIQFKIPDGVIQAQIAAIVSESLAKNGEELVRSMVTAVMAQQPKDSYRETKTIFETMCADMIRAVAKECFDEWLKEKRDDIKAALRARLGSSKDKTVKALADGIVEQLTSRMSVDVRLHMQD